MRIPIDGGHFFAGHGALSAVYLSYSSESATQSCGKMVPSLRVGSPMRPYCVAHRCLLNRPSNTSMYLWPAPGSVHARPRLTRLNAAQGHPCPCV